METIKKSIHEKLLMFQTGADPLKKDGENPHFKSRYATLSNALVNITPILNAVGLVLTQPIVDGVVKTVVTDVESGEHIESGIKMPDGLNAQQAGSAITYFRRYTMCSLLALAIDEDDDGQTATNNAATNGAAQTNELPEKQWLNKYTDKAQTKLSDKWIVAAESLQRGEVTIAKIEKKYKLSKELKAELEQLAMAAK